MALCVLGPTAAFNSPRLLSKLLITASLPSGGSGPFLHTHKRAVTLLCPCRLDLRFIPPEQSFEGRQVHDSASQVPSGYQAADFSTKALQHTRVQLTWDGDDEPRRKALTRRVKPEQLREDDFRVRTYAQGFLGSRAQRKASKSFGRRQCWISVSLHKLHMPNC